MFDPTIYENLKVVLEGGIYDLDLENVITVTKRADLIDLATMSRTYMIEFQLVDTSDHHAEIILSSTIDDFVKESMEGDVDSTGCYIHINFYTPLTNCLKIEHDLQRIWNNQPQIIQTISTIFRDNKQKNHIHLSFQHKINEKYVEDLTTIINLCLQSLRYFSNDSKRQKNT